MKKTLNILLLSILILLISCHSKQKILSYSEFKMDTIFDIKIYDSKPKKQVDRIVKQAFQEIEKMENHYSATRKSSLVFRLNRDKQALATKEDIAFFNRILKMSQEVHGVFDISIYPVMKAWGFGSAKYSIPSSNTLKNLIKEVDYRKIRIESNKIRLASQMEIDLGGVAKGLAVDRTCEFLKKNGITAGIVNAGGNLKVFGIKAKQQKWIIGIRHPRKQGELYETIPLRPDTAIATSGDYERYFESNGIRYHHLMNPKSGFPVHNGIVSVSVISPSAEKADLLSTALFIMGKTKALEYAQKNQIPVLIVMQNTNGLSHFQSAAWPPLVHLK